MAIIKQTDWPPIVVTTHATVQQVGDVPKRAYRELLMAENANGIPIPYDYDDNINAGNVHFIRIQHGMSVGAGVGALGVGGGAVQTVTPVATGVQDPSRIPDVVIPVLVEDQSAPSGGATIALMWDPNQQQGLPVSSTGMWADENYIFLAIRNPTAAAINRVKFVVYVEYTHSIITNEIVTGAYYYLT